MRGLEVLAWFRYSIKSGLWTYFQRVISCEEKVLCCMSEISVKYAFTESKYRLGMVSKGKNADCR